MKTSTKFLVALGCVLSFAAHAKYNGEDRGRPVMPGAINAKFQKECSDCHVAYAPGLLPAASWNKVMTGLDKHFGVDASISPADASEITKFLVNNASNRWTANTAPLRITDSVWFKTKHNEREVKPEVWKRASIKGAFNCTACHAGADKGDFNERGIKIPK